MIFDMNRIACIMLGILVLASCGLNEDGMSEVTLNVSRNEVWLDPDASVEEIEIESSTRWSIEGIPDWCGTVRPSYGEAGKWTVRIRGRFYEGRDDRSAMLSVVAGDCVETIGLYQRGCKMIRAELESARIPSAGGNVRVSVESDFDYTLEISGGDGWLELLSDDLPLSGEIVFTASPNKADADRTASLVFRQKDGDYVKELSVTQLSALSENRYYDGDVKLLQKSTRGNGVNVAIIGDGFVAEDLAYGGDLDEMASLALSAMFSTEPIKSYQDYFNVYLIAAESEDRGIGRVTAKNTALGTFFRSDEPTVLTMNLNAESVYSYMAKAGLTDRVNTAVLVIANTDEVGGTNISYPDGRCIAICTKSGPNHNGVAGVVNHELVGHAIGRLDEGYVYNSGYVTSDYVNTLKDRHSKGWSLNIDTTDDPEQVFWKHFIGVKGYEKVGCYNFGGGVVFMGGGVCEPENHFLVQDCMVDNSPYFNAPSREQIVKHILEIAGEEYSFEQFIREDKLRGPH